MIGMMAIWGLTGCSGSAPADGTPRLPSSTFQSEVAGEINAVRAANGLDPLALEPIGSPNASDYAEVLAEADSADHSGVAKEAIAICFANWYPLAKRVVTLWMNSPPHRAILLDANAKVLDVGCAIGWHRDGVANVESAFVVLRIQ